MELVHLLVPNHGKVFKSFLSAFLPDWSDKESRLNCIFRVTMLEKKSIVKNRGGVFIDDTGTPGARTPSLLLHSRRKSWAAVIIAEQKADELSEALDLLLRLVDDEFGASELHFTDIYSAKGNFKNVSIEARYEIFEYTARIFDAF